MVDFKAVMESTGVFVGVVRSLELFSIDVPRANILRGSGVYVVAYLYSGFHSYTANHKAKYKSVKVNYVEF